MPISLIIQSTGLLAFVRTAEFKPIIDNDKPIKAIFSREDFTIVDEQYEYDTLYEYKNIKNMLQYLQQQGLVAPQ